MKFLASLVTAVALNASVLAASATDSAAFTLEERAPVSSAQTPLIPFASFSCEH